MELKVTDISTDEGLGKFQSHLYGIERLGIQPSVHGQLVFQSHLYGIESFLPQALARLAVVSIAPLWN